MNNALSFQDMSKIGSDKIHFGKTTYHKVSLIKTLENELTTNMGVYTSGKESHMFFYQLHSTLGDGSIPVLHRYVSGRNFNLHTLYIAR